MKKSLIGFLVFTAIRSEVDGLRAQLQASEERFERLERMVEAAVIAVEPD